jgi:hypothetical protein
MDHLSRKLAVLLHADDDHVVNAEDVPGLVIEDTISLISVEHTLGVSVDCVLSGFRVALPWR